MRKLRLKPLYKVYNRITKKVYSKGTTKEKAEKQLRLLRAIEYNPDFVPRPASATPRGARARRTISRARSNKIPSPVSPARENTTSSADTISV